MSSSLSWHRCAPLCQWFWVRCLSQQVPGLSQEGRVLGLCLDGQQRGAGHLGPHTGVQLGTSGGAEESDAGELVRGRKSSRGA